VLFWDEPEANINPSALPDLVDILLELQRDGVQIFLATHNYNLAKYFEVYRSKDDNIMYYNLEKTKDGVIYNKANTYREIRDNSIENANEKLYNEILDKTAEDIENE
jgi:ABC-type multidrug transport system ATPase subunit